MQHNENVKLRYVNMTTLHMCLANLRLTAYPLALTTILLLNAEPPIDPNIDWNECYASVWDEWTPDTVPGCSYKTLVRSRFANCGLAIGEIAMFADPDVPECSDPPLSPPFLADCNQTGEYLGCIADYPRTQEYIWIGERINKTTCIEACLGMDDAYTIASLQYGSQCGCSRGFRTGKPGLASNCDANCVGNPREKCGGDYAMTTYCLGEFKVWCPPSNPRNLTRANFNSTTSNNVTRLDCYAKLLNRTYAKAEAAYQCYAIGGRLPVFYDRAEIANFLEFRKSLATEFARMPVWIEVECGVNSPATTNTTSLQMPPQSNNVNKTRLVIGRSLTFGDAVNLTDDDLGTSLCLLSTGPGDTLIVASCMEKHLTICQFEDKVTFVKGSDKPVLWYGDVRNRNGNRTCDFVLLVTALMSLRLFLTG